MVFYRNLTYKYRDVAFTDEYIFALFDRDGQMEFNKTGVMAEEKGTFNHKGKPLWNLRLDRSIIQIVVNEQTSEIYGLTTDEDPEIVFHIPEELL